MAAPRRLASVAPDREPRPRTERLDGEIHNTCVQWAAWFRTRSRFGSPHAVGSIMGQLLRIPGKEEGRNARCDPQLAAFHLAVIEWPYDYLPRRVFEAHYLTTPERNIKRMAADAGIGRATWYRTVNAFARLVYARHFALMRGRVSLDETK